MKKLLLVLFMLFIISCSTTKIVEVPVEKVHTEYINKIQYDSVYIKDSIDKFIKGDTIFIYKQNTKYRYIHKVDTFTKIDSVPYPVKYETIVEVNKLKWYQEWLMLLGIVLILYIGLMIIKKL